ncbi:MAG: transglutaminase domain-containing protein [Lachnospiraceae bacterium]|nr:transglutaminase domain-containing protein [Lachnospiraceae bacterium]
MKKKYKICFAVLGLLLILSVGFIIYVAFFGGYSLFYMSYQQSPNEIYIMESGILYNQLEFKAGNDYEISYDFENEEYKELLEKYDLINIAKDGSEFDKAKNLMNEFAPRLKHKSDYDNHVDMNAMSLLEYSLDNKKHGINCRNKAQILNEMCLALGIYSRKVWIMPNSKYDRDCHVVNVVWDSTYNKWIMLDITNNMYWVDENGNPLSILEIRTKIANQEFCTPVDAEDNLKDLDKSLNNNFDNFLYIAKNLVYMEYMGKYTKNEDDTFYLLFPENLDTNFEYIISEKAIEASPK